MMNIYEKLARCSSGKEIKRMLRGTTWLLVHDWLSFELAPERDEPIVVYRKDAGVFMAHFVSPAQMCVGDDEEKCWFTTDGEDLTGDLPTHWMPDLPEPNEAQPAESPSGVARGSGE